jgi:hypothetical protein
MDLITMYTIAQLIPKHLRPVFFKIRNSELLVVSRTKHKISIVHLLTPLHYYVRYNLVVQACFTGRLFRVRGGCGVHGGGVQGMWGWAQALLELIDTLDEVFVICGIIKVKVDNFAYRKNQIQ